MAVLMTSNAIPKAYNNNLRVKMMRKGKPIANFAPHQSSEYQIAEVVNR